MTIKGGISINSAEANNKKRLAKFALLFSSTVIIGQSFLYLHEALGVVENKLEQVSDEKEILSESLHILEKKYQESNFEIDELTIENGKLAKKLKDKEEENKGLLTSVENLEVALQSEKQANQDWGFEEVAIVAEDEFEQVVEPVYSEGRTQVTDSSSDGWVTMNAEATAYTMVANGDALGGTGLTSTGTVPTANRTIAVDPDVIPYGSLVRYNGITYTAEDTGGVIIGNKVDFYFDTMEECVSFGIQNITIEVKV